MVVVPELKPPQPDAAVSVKVIAEPVAVPPVVGLMTSQEGALADDVSTVKAVPPVAVEVTETVWLMSGV